MGQILSSIFSDDHKIPDNNNHGYYHEYEEKAEAYYIFSNIIQPPASQSTRSTRRNGITRGNYNRHQRILVVGDGDFSFSASLAMALGSASNMVATSLDSLDFLKNNYKRSMSNINELKARGCKVLHCVDATQMANHPQLYHIKFDRIIFNFPLAGFFPKEISRQLQIQSVNYHYLCFLTLFSSLIK
uniref:25S rRNA (uridine-N(3))-methyltransferase BMT5-like domain-containing protein n=1 Tax=Opuntia streptacantha TaxID=393608 RepID=A0A7C9DWC6_OPUST